MFMYFKLLNKLVYVQDGDLCVMCDLLLAHMSLKAQVTFCSASICPSVR